VEIPCDNSRERTELENFKLLVSISGDEKLFWDRFNVFTALDSALSGFSFLDQVAKGATSTLLLSFLGIVLSLLWFFMTARARAYIEHWICLAREIEENKLKDLTFFKEECRFKKSLSWYEKLKEYELWRGKPVWRKSFRETLLGKFNFYNLENEKIYLSSSQWGKLPPPSPQKCPIYGRVFSRGRYPHVGMMRHVYKWHKDVCMGYDCAEAYLDLILYKKRVDNILFRSKYSALLGGTHPDERERIKTFEDFEAVFADLMVGLAPITCEVKASSKGLPGRLSKDQEETKALAVKYGWGWLALGVCIGERVTAEVLELHMPNSGKIRRGVREFFRAR
jgi:hypothetical protein